MNSKCSFYFMRHGQTDAHADDRNIPLNEKGIEQAQRVAEQVESLNLKSICHSPLPRAIQTKDIIAKNLLVPHFQIRGLEECTSRVWTDLTSPQNVSVLLETKAFHQRVVAGVKKSLLKPGPTLLVAHGGVHVALCNWLSISRHTRIIDNCCLVHFKKMGDQWIAQIMEK